MKTTRSIRSFQRTFEQAFRSHYAPFRTQPQARALHLPTPTTRLAASQKVLQPRRHHSTDAESTQRPLTDREATSTSDADSIALRKALSPAYQLWFTCKKCLERSGHTISKQAYHFGTCVINCPKCKSQHLISDHLKIFSDTSKTMEDIAKEHGEKLRKGRLGADGDVEFYDDAADETIENEMKKG
ncbi:hypothetical protein M409DRAFT_15729 [Zasmidium cellare ATCC 36951]|uniref:DNL-type domain-containing protein n=1 Tax=Zasmidium cellare ATCC 36951 TaxID=1080233 RepID=A0A6A6D2N5_ZASCE|nr:uncharacterized protein M409DRAFT_15729 [Zasmidium cellare ATCC 36951]KAF2173445.1 hypothetical protein M409DRAFT_15729 [Zasmidium cellare ATCC 36951]